jgi:hypothetical protein
LDEKNTKNRGFVMLENKVIPDYAKSGEEPKIVVAACLPYTHNGMDGFFYLGTERLTDELLIRPVDWRWERAERWGRVQQTWFDLAFKGASNILSVISFKKNSAVNVYADIMELQERGVALTSVWLKLRSEKVEVGVVDDAGPYEDSYYAVKVKDWDVVSEADAEGMKLWKEANTFDWNIVGEVS